MNKVATIATRIFAVESATYRVVGAIDKAVAAGTDKLSAIENYAAEASMLKVLGSELLDYAVDEGVQIHGGYGYSAEYDTEVSTGRIRIQHTFEGTNEINRLIILDRTLPALAGEQGSPEGSNSGDWLNDTVQKLNRLSLTLLQAADAQYGKKLRGEQPIILRVADLLMLSFAASSATARARKLQSEVASAMAQLYVYEAAEQSASIARELTGALQADERTRALLSALTATRLNLRQWRYTSLQVDIAVECKTLAEV